jgi:WD repeat-containing protein 61
MSASDDRRLVLYDARTSSSSSSAVAHLSGHTHSVLAVALSPGDGRLALSGGRDGTVRVWDVGMRKAVGVVREGGAVWSVAWRPVVRGEGAGGDVEMADAGVSVIGGGGGIGGSGAMGFVTGGEEGAVRWYRGAGMV